METKEILKQAIPLIIEDALPDKAVKRALADFRLPSGRLYIASVGKAAWSMASAAAKLLAGKYEKGLIITKYQHAKGAIPGFTIYEAGHPIVDENSLRATQALIDLCHDLQANDEVLFLLSGGGSALFEKPLIPFEQLQALNEELLKKGADIVEINTIRKRLSSVKGGRFAQLCQPAHVTSVILSDVVSDRPDMIASGPTYPDASSAAEALDIVAKYQLTVSPEVRDLLSQETIRELNNITTMVTGGVKRLCKSAQEIITAFGYETSIINDQMTLEVKDACAYLKAFINERLGDHHKAYIFGGENVVRVKGRGLGGRNQELALRLAREIRGLPVSVLALASDGTDGPTDAAGGLVDGNSLGDKNIDRYLDNNDSYHGLQLLDSLVITGATGTNVNDVTIIIID